MKALSAPIYSSIRRLGQRWRPGRWAYAAIAVVLVLGPLVTSSYILGIVIKILIFAIFALSLNLLWGYTGLFSLGHAAYFGVAGYTLSILIVRCNVESFWIVAPLAMMVTAAVAALAAIPALRVAGAYFLLVTLAIGELLSSVASKWESVTGGSNGLVGVGYPDLGWHGMIADTHQFYYLVLICAVGTLAVLYRVVNSPFGYAVQGIRANENRMAALGYHVWLYKYIAFITGGCFAGLAGILFAYYSGIMAPPDLAVLTSTYVMLMVVLGGCEIVIGPVLGAAIVVVLEHVASIYVPERWPLIFGGVFVLVAVCFSGGVGGYLARWWQGAVYGSAKRQQPE